MNQEALDLTADLAEELSAGGEQRAFVDPRSIPTRFSLLKKLWLSPAHYLEAAQEPQDDTMAHRLGAFASDRKESYRMGGAIHAMITGTGRVISYAGKRDERVKAWRDFRGAAAANGVVEILSSKEMVIAREVADAIRRHDLAMRILFDGTIVERRIDWEWMGKAVRSTPDARKPGSHVADLKSAVSAEPRAFARQSARLFYHCQADLYSNAIVAAGEAPVHDHYVVAVEKTRPHPVQVYRFTAEMLKLGARQLRLWMERLLQCEAANAWPAYAGPDAVIDIDVEEDWAA